MDTSFVSFLLRRMTVNEVSEFFPTSAMNQLFRAELGRILTTEDLSEEQRQDLVQLRSLNLVGYVDSSVRRSGVDEADRDEVVHDLLVRLLVSPGSLFKKWDRKSPMSARLKVAIRNSIFSLAKKRQRRARRFQELPDIIASPPCMDDVGTINAFRDALRSQYGEDHVRVLDTRLAGNDIKGLIGSPGIPTSYRLKQIVQDIKRFVVGWGDSCLERAISQMRVREEETLAKRFGRVPAGG